MRLKQAVLDLANRDPEFRRELISSLRDRLSPKLASKFSARKVRSIIERGVPGSMILWEVSGAGSHHVVTSYNGEETLVFKSDANGKVLKWAELPGSARNSSHGDAIQGYLDSLN